MSEEIYEEPQLTKKSDNTDFRNGHNDESIYVNCRPTKFIQPKPEDQATEQHLSIENKERNQLRSDVDKLISERDELQTNYSKFRIIHHNLTEALKDEKEFLKTMNRNLTTERDELKAQIEATRCPSSWIKFDNSCYLISDTSKSWNDGRDMCKDHGADLVIISNIMEQAFITSLKEEVWIGLTDKEKEDTWKWVNGEAVATTYWKQGEPINAGGGEDCVLILNIFPKINNWNDFPWIEIKERKQQNVAQLVSERNELQTNYSELKNLSQSLTQANIQLMNENRRLITERDELKAQTAIEIKKANQLRSDGDKLISERDELQTSYSEATNLSHDLKQKTNLLKDVNEFLKTINRNLSTERDELKAQIEATRCASSWIKFENSCYFISDTLKSWNDGRNMCKDHGADLVIISNFMEQKFISSFNQLVWIGLTDEETENSWKWVNGEAATTTYFHEKQPDNHGSAENCVEINDSFPPTNNWNDFPCNSLLKFICEKVLN
ncbi:uncharacterized protein V6R79_007635 [Siganus canaliculatus]